MHFVHGIDERVGELATITIASEWGADEAQAVLGVAIAQSEAVFDHGSETELGESFPEQTGGGQDEVAGALVARLAIQFRDF